MLYILPNSVLDATSPVASRNLSKNRLHDQPHHMSCHRAFKLDLAYDFVGVAFGFCLPFCMLRYSMCAVIYTKIQAQEHFLDVLQFAGDGLMERHKTAPGEAVTKVLANIETWKMRLIHMVCADQKS